MSKITVKSGQSLVDISIQYLGSAEGLVSLAQLNNVSVTQGLTAGSELLLPEVIDKRVARVFSVGGYFPASEGDPATISITLPIQRYVIRSSAAPVAVVKAGQRLIDISIQYLGSPEGVVSLAQLNNVSVAGTLTPGTILQLPDVLNVDVVNYFLTGGHEPATDTEGDIAPGGIGYMEIEFDFKVG